MGLNYTDILELNVGFILGLLNEKNNQMVGLKNKNTNDEVIQGDASMLMKM